MVGRLVVRGWNAIGMNEHITVQVVLSFGGGCLLVVPPSLPGFAWWWLRGWRTVGVLGQHSAGPLFGGWWPWRLTARSWQPLMVVGGWWCGWVGCELHSGREHL